MVRFSVIVVCACVATCLAVAADGVDPAAADAPTDAADVLAPDDVLRAKAQALVDEFILLHMAFENKSAVVLAERLGPHQPFVIERVALERLSEIGMPPQLYVDYRLALRAGVEAKTGGHRKAIAEWASAHDRAHKPAQTAKPLALYYAVSALCSNWEWQIDAELDANRADTIDYVATALGCTQLVRLPKEKSRLITGVLKRLNKDTIVAANIVDPKLLPPPEIETEQQAAAVLSAISKWCRDNLKYCYFHPTERRLNLDKEARDHKTPTAEYRKQHPWGKDEGPNHIDYKNIPSARP